MYFSLLPLLLLFASTICASPKGTTLINGVELPNSHQDRYLYRFWYHWSRRRPEQRIDGVDVAVKTIRSYVIVRVEVICADVGHVKDLIDNLGQDLVYWRWGLVLGGRRVAFIIDIKPGGEEAVKKYLSIIRVDEFPSVYKDTHLHTHSLQLLNGLILMDGVSEIRDRWDIVVRANVMKIDYGRVRMMITDLSRGGNLLSWGWSIIPDDEQNRVAVSIRLKSKVKGKVKEYLALY